MLLQANATIKNSMVRLQDLQGDNSYIKRLTLNKAKKYIIHGEVPLLCKLSIPEKELEDPNNILSFRFKYQCEVHEEVHVYGSFEQRQLKEGSCFWGEKPTFKRLSPFTGKLAFYLAFYSKTGCESVEIKPSFNKRFDFAKLSNTVKKE